MTSLWLAVIIAALGCYALKLAGVSIPAPVLQHPRVRRTASLLPVAMLSALVVVELIDDGGRYGWDWTTAAGVATGVLALWLGRGVLVVFLVAVTVTAVLRLVT